MRFIRGLIKKITGFALSAQAKRNMRVILKWSPVALSYIKYFSALTPTQVDDEVLAWMSERYPRYFNGVPLTDEELGAFRLLGAAGQMIVDHPGELTETQARTAVQLRYAALQGEEDHEGIP